MTDKLYYSAIHNGFYSDALKEQYAASKNGWPEDAVEISQEEHDGLLAGLSKGKILSASEDGYPVLTDPVINWQAKAEAQRQSLLTAANAATADWRTELQLDVISEDDKASLVKWMTYIKSLKALDLNSVSDEGRYSAIVWPEKPIT